MCRPLSARVPTDEVIRLYKSGATATAIADQLGTSQSVVLRRLDRFGVGRRGRGRFSVIPLTPIVKLYQSGLSVGEVSRRVGVSKTAVRWRLKKAGVRIRQNVKVSLVGSANHQWRGGRTMSRGYVLISVGHGVQIPEHRIVMERQIGRPLTSAEIVHHLNGIRHDNRIDNLALTTLKDHEHQTYVKCLQARIRDLESQIKTRD